MKKQKIRDIKGDMKRDLELIFNRADNFFVFYYSLKFVLSEKFPISVEDLTPSVVFNDLIDLYKSL